MDPVLVIESLQREGIPYHATPVWKVENILEHGLRVDYARPKPGIQDYYQCLHYSMKVAIDMALLTNRDAIRQSRIKRLGIFGFNLQKLRWQDRRRLKIDPRLNDGICTYSNLPPASIEHLVIANLVDDRLDLAIKPTYEALLPSLEVIQIYYSESDGKYRLIR